MFKINLKGGKFYRKFMGNRENTGEMLKKIYESNLKLNKETVVGKPIQIDNKTLYPVIEIVTIGNRIQNYVGAEISPVAILVEESDNEYLFSLTDEEINPEEILEMISKD
jgi:uncharacterized spore protein YtfJ